MMEELLLIIPMVSLSMFTIGVTAKLYKRSVSTFMSLVIFTITSNCMYYGYIDCGLFVLLGGMTVMFYRAMLKPTNDTFLVKTYRGEEKRNRREKECSSSVQ